MSSAGSGAAARPSPLLPVGEGGGEGEENAGRSRRSSVGWVAQSPRLGGADTPSAQELRLQVEHALMRIAQNNKRLVETGGESDVAELPKEEMDALWIKYDEDRNGYLGLDEFRHFVIDVMRYQAEAEVLPEELRKYLRGFVQELEEHPDRHTAEILHKLELMDSDGDGKVTKQEFEENFFTLYSR